MASTGKKGKKAKWVPVSITNILAQPTAIPTTQSWADAADEEHEQSYGYATKPRAPVVLPSESRAACGGLTVDDDSIPRRPPYVAYISNLPYDVDETAIGELFEGLKIQNLRLPREGDRLKGFGYVDFEDRESLVDAMNIADLTISGRRIRIEVSTQDNDRRMGTNRGGRMGDRERDYDPERTTGDWRSGPRSEAEPTRGRPSDRDRPREREREGLSDDRRRSVAVDPIGRGGPERAGGGTSEPGTRAPPGTPQAEEVARGAVGSPRGSNEPVRAGAWRDGDRPAAEPARAAYGGRDSYGRDRDRDRGGFEDRDRDRTASSEPVRAGAWRDGDRPAPEPARAAYGGRDSYGRDRDRDRGGFEDRDRERGGGGGGGGERERGYGRDGTFRPAPDRDRFREGDRGSSRGFGERRGFGDRDRERDAPREEAKPRERPKLNLLPRTVPREAEPDAEPAAAAGAGAADDKPEEDRPAPRSVPASALFGGAKPVDTAAKEREIEERLKKQEEARRGGDEEKRWTRRADGPADSRAPRRSEEPRGGGGGGYRERRDEPRDGGREAARDGSREGRERGRDGSRGGRTYSRDDPERTRDARDAHDARDAPDTRDAKDGGGARDKDNGERVRSAERVEERPAEIVLPTLKEKEAPNFAATNKFSFLEDADGGTSD